MMSSSGSINAMPATITSESSTSLVEFIMATVCKICAGPIELPDQHYHCVACLRRLAMPPNPTVAPFPSFLPRGLLPARPRNCLTSFLVLGLGQAATAAVLSIWGRTCPWPKLKPSRYTSTRPIAHFHGFAVSPATLSDLRTAQRCSICRCQSLLWMMMSSR